MFHGRWRGAGEWIALSTISALAAAGCASTTRLKAVPVELQDKAAVPGLPRSVRSWGDVLNDDFVQECFGCVRREQAALLAAGGSRALAPAHFLAISGGGANGAFGAGLLCGWTAAGTRPEFKIVTGISTGALTAPFAFLGAGYDEALRDVYTTVRTRDILTRRGILAAVFNDALADNRPLWNLLSRLVDEKMLRAVAAEYEKGRLLLILTVDLDAERPVIWNMAAIAASNHPKALNVFRSLMIASAAIPAAFPPVMIDVEADSKRFQEMHVDGGAMAQVFLYPPSFNLAAEARGAGMERDRHLYIIRNARLDPAWAEVNRRTLKIAGRAISALIQTQGVGDLYRLYASAKRDQIDFNLAYIPRDFREQPKEEFDAEYMKKLFDRGYRLAQSGYPWSKTPPDFAPSRTSP